MELGSYIAIYRRQASLFWLIVAFAIAAAWVWHQDAPEGYQATLLLNIGRSGIQATGDYTFDSFYRLQADERFADTVVRWLGSPRIVEDIHADARLDSSGFDTRSMKRVFLSKRLSSQMIEVVYSAPDVKTAQRLAPSISRVLNTYAESLNARTAEPNWFVVIGSDPVIRDLPSLGLSLSLALGLALGLFSGFWIVLLRHYFSRKQK